MNLKELLNIAKTELSGMSTLDNPDFRLEQAEIFEMKGQDVWSIVVSYLIENTNPRNSALSALTSEYKYHRIYKELRIDKNNKVIGLYMYDGE